MRQRVGVIRVRPGLSRRQHANGIRALSYRAVPAQDEGDPEKRVEFCNMILAKARKWWEDNKARLCPTGTEAHEPFGEDEVFVRNTVWYDAHKSLPRQAGWAPVAGCTGEPAGGESRWVPTGFGLAPGRVRRGVPVSAPGSLESRRCIQLCSRFGRQPVPQPCLVFSSEGSRVAVLTRLVGRVRCSAGKRSTA